MSNPLDKFILENREKFDDEIADPIIWKKIDERLNPDEKKTSPVRSLPFKRWMTAAAAVVIIGTGTLVYYSLQKNNQPVPDTASKLNDKSNNLPDPPKSDTTSGIARTEAAKPEKVIQQPLSTVTETGVKEGETPDDKAMYYYAKLIELKHDELKTLEKDEPLLYKQFSGDVKKLDNVYHALKTQLPDNSNREQVIEAMISNLQLQIALLNKQLKIIKQIKHSKKSAYEKAYKSI